MEPIETQDHQEMKQQDILALNDSSFDSRNLDHKSVLKSEDEDIMN